CCSYLFVFFFQAEDGIRDRNVTGVQTCALPISALPMSMRVAVIPCGLPSREVTAASPAKPAFEAAYGAEWGRGVWAAMDPLNRIRPPEGSCADMARNAARAVRK